jgi:CCR4-NOT transcription complex subunit 3
MDKVFKKIIEGLEIFDTLYERHENAASSSQKEKLENDLKKEIKKLQRFREQVKNWQAANEIKDKNQLLEHRRLVEVAMEKYKVVEKGSKTKAYSDQSLAAVDEPEIDNEAIEFVRQSLDALQQQTESLESEIERLQPSKKTKKSIHNEEQKKELEELLSSHQWHTEKLEIVLRLLQNEILSVDEVMNISDDITYYLDENRSPDFMFDDTIYDDLDLEADQTLINDIHVIPEDNNVPGSSAPTSESSPIPESVSRSRSIQPTSRSNSNSRSNSIPVKSIPSNAVPTGIISNNSNKHDSHEKPPVIQSIGTSSNNQATVTTLKPAPVPALATEMKWSTVVKKKDSPPNTSSLANTPTSVTPSQASAIQTPAQSVVPPPLPQLQSQSAVPVSESSNQLPINTNALNAASVLEALKKQKPKESPSPSNESTSMSTVNSVPLPTPASTSIVPPPIAAIKTTSLNVSTSNEQQEPVEEKVPDSLFMNKAQSSSPSIAFSKSQELASQTNGFRFLPPGIQSFILSISSSKDLMHSTYNPFQSVNHTPNKTYPTGLKAIHLAESWNKIKISKDLLAVVSNLDLDSLFFGYYYGRSSEERNVALNVLSERGWKKDKSQAEWFLAKSILSKGDGWNIGDFTVFNVDKWATSERKNIKVETSKFI